MIKMLLEFAAILWVVSLIVVLLIALFFAVLYSVLLFFSLKNKWKK